MTLPQLPRVEYHQVRDKSVRISGKIGHDNNLATIGGDRYSYMVNQGTRIHAARSDEARGSNER